MAQPFKPVPTAVDRWTTEVKAYGVAEVTSRYFPPEAVEGRLSVLEPWVCRTRPGETLVLYSDGVIEAKDGRREEYGLGRLKETLWEARGLEAQGVVQACLQDLGRFAGPAPQGDDVTLMVVRAIR